MRKVLSLPLIFCSILFPSHVLAEMKILFPGNVIELDLYPENGKSLNGAEFLALHKVDGKYFLSKTAIVAAAIPGEVIEISSNVDGAIAFIRDKSIKSGAVTTATFEGGGTSNQVAGLQVSNSKIPIRLENRSYSVHDTFVPDKSYGLSIAGVDGKSIVLQDRVGFVIIWAGDMDRDGEIDLIVNSQDPGEKNSSSCLLLSSIAKKPELVKLFTCQAYSG